MRTYGLRNTVALLLGADAPKENADPKDAEKLFRAMEEKLAKAKTLACVFDVTLNAIPYKGSLVLGESNRARLEIHRADKAKTMRVRTVSDGTRLSHQDDGMPRPQVEDAPKNLNADLLMWLARPGVFLPQAPLPDVKADDAKDRFQVSDFELGKKEKVVDRDIAPGGDIGLAVMDKKDPFSVVVWIDSRTGLPVKRTITSRVGGEETSSTETAAKFSLDAKHDAKQFRLPE